jgi:hypothetical protein
LNEFIDLLLGFAQSQYRQNSEKVGRELEYGSDTGITESARVFDEGSNCSVKRFLGYSLADELQNSGRSLFVWMGLDGHG